MNFNDKKLRVTFPIRVLFAAIFVCPFPQTTVSFAQVVVTGDPVHEGSLLTAYFGHTLDPQTGHPTEKVPEVWEHSGDFQTADAQAQPPTTPGPIDRAFGAFTVKNENDTDGDGLLDFEDNNVIAVGTNNRDEVDLIKFEILLPENLNALSTISLRSYGPATAEYPQGAPCVVFWKHKTKTEKFGDGLSITLNSGTKGQKIAVWGEMTGQSTAIASWYVKCTYVLKDGPEQFAEVLQNKFDRISVTSIWAEALGTRASRHEVQILEKPSPFEIGVPLVAGIDMNPGDWVVIYNDRTAPDPAVYDTATLCDMRRVLSFDSHPIWPELGVVEFLDALPSWVDQGDFFTDGLSRDVDSNGLIETFNLFHIFCHIGATRYRNRPAHGLQTRYVVVPYGMAVTRMSNGEFPKFDIARQATQQRKVGFPALRIPWPLGTEEPNDQQGAGG